jgi:hypothetical protein
MNKRPNDISDDIQNNELIDAERKYFTMIPNIVFELGLTTCAIILYCVLRRVAGEKGRCWMSTVSLAEKCNMSTGSVSECKKELLTAELIGIVSKKCDKGSYHEIRIIDIWKRNIDYFTCSRDEKVGSSCGEQVRSCDERKKNSVKKNQEIPQETLQPPPVLPAKKDTSNMTTVEEHKRRTEEALRASYTNANTGYTHEYPEDIRPVIERIEARWGLKAPPRPRGGKGKQYAYWIESCRALLDACAEFGVGSLDLLRDDFEAYMAGHSGVAPHTYSTPNSLVNSMLSKAAQLRSGNTAPMWGNKRGEQPARQTRLDV